MTKINPLKSPVKIFAMKPSAIIFDLDGTLLDTLPDIARAANRVLAENGLPQHPIQSFQAFIGSGAWWLVYRALPEDHRDEATVTALTASFKKVYGTIWQERTRPFPGIVSMLSGLGDRKLKLGVLSNKPDSFTRLCVEAFLPANLFAHVQGQVDGLPKKPDPAPALQAAEALQAAASSCCLVGDSEIDVATGLAAGMSTIGVLWGYRSKEELLLAGAEAVIERPEELLDLMDASERF
jgi:phosphoglycolate phosphatase